MISHRPCRSGSWCHSSSIFVRYPVRDVYGTLGDLRQVYGGTGRGLLECDLGSGARIREGVRVCVVAEVGKCGTRQCGIARTRSSVRTCAVWSTWQDIDADSTVHPSKVCFMSAPLSMPLPGSRASVPLILVSNVKYRGVALFSNVYVCGLVANLVGFFITGNNSTSHHGCVSAN